MVKLSPAYIYGWTEKIKNQLITFKENRANMSVEEQSEFITRQYYLLQLINKALDGRIQFIGAYQPNRN
jgi:hypothetical protein